MEEAAKATLPSDIDVFYKYAQDHHVLNYRMWAVLVGLSLILVAATTLAAFSLEPQLAGKLSIANGLVIAFQAAFAFGDSAQFYRTVASQAQVLRFDAQSARSPDEIKKLTADYRVLVEKLGRELPIGSGMAAAQGIAGNKRD